MSKFRIYRIDGGSPVLLADIGTSVFEYLDRKVSKTLEYRDGITAVNKQGGESDPAYVTVK